MGIKKWYWATVLQKIFFFREKEMNLVVHDKKWSGRLFMISIANGSRYGGSFLVAMPSRLLSDTLDK